MTRHVALVVLLLGPAAALPQTLPPASSPIAIDAPASPGDTVRLGEVTVTGLLSDRRSNIGCWGGGSRVDCRSTSVLVQWQVPAFVTIQPTLTVIAGVQVTPYSGAPGAWATVRIRGVANVSGNAQPLYVVDGVPVYNTDVTPERWPAQPGSLDALGTIATPHSAVANPLLDIPVEDVMRIEVVQGAAATARYGMQGTNGVILVTTRRGADGKEVAQPLRVRYNAWGGVQQVRQRYALLSGQQFASLANAAAANTGRPAPYPPATLDNLETLDWQNQAFRVAGMQTHNLSVDGLTNHHTRYYVAADYLRQAGVLRESSLSRYHLRTSLDQQLTPKLRTGLKASASQTAQRYAGDFDASQLLRNVLLAVPAVRPGSPSSPATNPLAALGTSYHAPRTRRLLVQVDAAYQLNADVNLSVRGSREQAEAREQGYAPGSPVETSTGTASVHSWVADAALNYQHTVSDRHAFTGALAYQYQQFERQWGERAYNQFQTSEAKLGEKSHGIHSPSALVRYGYDGRYEAQASLRSDFVPGGEYRPAANYWSPGAQLSWHLHKEAWLADASHLSNLTLWVGTGRTGTFLASAPFLSTAPPDRTTQHDAGVSVGLFDGRLSLDVVAYQRRTFQAQAVVSVIASGTQQAQLMQLSSLTVHNRGLTLSVAHNWKMGALLGSSRLAAATNRNEIEDLNTPYSSFGPQVLEVGQPVSRFALLRRDGIYPVGSPRAGQVRYRDDNNDGVPDVTPQGSGLPRHTLSLFQELKLDRFELEAQFDGLFGYQVLNPTLAALDAPTGYANSSARALNYWTPTNPNTSIPPAGSAPPALSDQDLASGNHVRLTQLSISYAVRPAEAHRIVVWVGGQNLFVTGSYRGFDPNVSSGGADPLQAGQDASVYPVARVWQLGVRATL